jgi:hypothetical protein
MRENMWHLLLNLAKAFVFKELSCVGTIRFMRVTSRRSCLWGSLASYDLLGQCQG